MTTHTNSSKPVNNGPLFHPKTLNNTFVRNSALNPDFLSSNDNIAQLKHFSSKSFTYLRIF